MENFKYLRSQLKLVLKLSRCVIFPSMHYVCIQNWASYRTTTPTLGRCSVRFSSMLHMSLHNARSAVAVHSPSLSVYLSTFLSLCLSLSLSLSLVCVFALCKQFRHAASRWRKAKKHVSPVCIWICLVYLLPDLTTVVSSTSTLYSVHCTPHTLPAVYVYLLQQRFNETSLPKC